MRHEFSKKITEKIEEALKLFGEYNYYDKGPHEVMDVNPLVAEIEKLSDEELADVCIDLMNHPHGTFFMDSFIEDLEFDYDKVQKIIKDAGIDTTLGNGYWDYTPKKATSVPITQLSKFLNRP